MELSTIAGETPIGLCGTGIIDAVGEAVRLGLIDENGTFEEPWFTDGMPVAEGRFRFRQEDVRQVQMGKAAIRAGIETLLARSGKRYEDVSAVLLAGGFGASMDLRSACAIGLLPPALRGRTRHVGNSAGLGAALCLAARCRYLELSGARDFDERFIDAMFFDEWEDLDG